MSKRPESIRALRSVAQPKQARSEESLRRLLDAAESLIEERGFGEVSIADIARRARSSVGGFYARFRDKDELLLALHERFVAELEEQFARMESALPESAQLTDLLRPTLRMMTRLYGERRALLGAFASRVAENRRLNQAGLGFRRAVIARYTQLLLRWRKQITHADPELAAELAVQLAIAFMDQTLLNGKVRVGGDVLPDGRLEEELERVVLSYLGCFRPTE